MLIVHTRHMSSISRLHTVVLSVMVLTLHCTYLSCATIQLQGVVSQVMSFKAKSLNKLSKQVSCGRFRHTSESDYGYYNERILCYAHFVHSLSLLERLLLCEGGRDLFPVQLNGGICKFVCGERNKPSFCTYHVNLLL